MEHEELKAQDDMLVGDQENQIIIMNKDGLQLQEVNLEEENQQEMAFEDKPLLNDPSQRDAT